MVGGPDLAALFEYTFRTRIPKSSNQYAALFFSIVDDILIGYFSSTSKTTHIRKFYDNKACLDFTIGVKHHFEQCYCGRKFNDEINQSIRRKTADKIRIRHLKLYKVHLAINRSQNLSGDTH